MHCPNCGTENFSRAKFCSNCGSPIGVPCPGCGFSNPREAASCGGCGRTLSAPHVPVAERRQLTIVFSDVVGSTDLSARLDPEDLSEFYSRYHAVCAEAIQHYEGYLAQYLGDGVLAYFGYPAAHEDDAGRAVRAGLEILKRAASLAVGGERPPLRIGVHTGLVVVGGVGDSARTEQLALGEAPNIAARLQSEAAPDTMVISDATRALLAGQFEIEDLGPRTLKGLSRPMQIFRVTGESNLPSRFHAMQSAHGLTSFIGREREVETIRSAWTEAAVGHGRSLLLRGEAGMGKSRLLEAAGQIASGTPHERFEAQCSSYRTNSALYPIVEMIERRLGVDVQMSPAHKLDLLEQFTAGRSVSTEATTVLAELLSIPTLDRYPAIDLPPAKRLQLTITVLAGLLLHSVESLPVLLFVEDLHWADPSTLDLLAAIVERLPEHPVLMVCTTRPDFDPTWLSAPQSTEIRVAALSAEETRALIARIGGNKPLPLSLVQEIVTRTGGIPLFTEAVTRTVMSSGLLRECEDRYELTGPVPAALIPGTVKDSLMARIDRLGADRPVAQMAATIGRESSFELLEEVLRIPASQLKAALACMVEQELVAESGEPPESTYTFRHALIQDCAYESLLRKTRQEFHGRIAEALLRRFPDIAETRPELLARHHEGAGKTAEAIAGWMRAGNYARQRQALRECQGYLRLAISLLESLPEDDSTRLQLEMEAQLVFGHVMTETFGWASRELESTFTRALELCSRLNNPIGRLQALNGLSGVHVVRGEMPQAKATASEVHALAVASASPLLVVPASLLFAVPNFYMGDLSTARKFTEQALAISSPELEREIVAAFHFPSTVASAHICAMSLWCQGYAEQAKERWRQGIEIMNALGDSPARGIAAGYVMNSRYLLRNLAEVESFAALSYRRATEDGNLFWSSHARIFLGWAQAMSGETEAGIAEMNAGLDAYRFIGSGINTTGHHMMMAEALISASRAEEATEWVVSALAHAAEFEERVYEPELRRVLAEAQLMLGEPGKAEESLRTAIEVAQSRQSKMFELRAAVQLAMLLREQRRTEEAAGFLQPLDEWFEEGRDTPELRSLRAALDALGAAQPAEQSGHSAGAVLRHR